MSTPPDQPGNSDADKPIDSAAPTAEEIDALLNEPPAADATSEQVPAETAEQSEMLASLNSALQNLPSDAPANEPAPTYERASNEVKAEPAEAMSIEDKLQQEIASLMNAEPQAAAAQASQTPANELDGVDALTSSFEAPETVAAISETPAAEPSIEDQIAMEIEDLLAVDEPASATATAAVEPPEAAIDELDQMLAQEIDADDELAGDFQSVEDVTAGIQTDSAAATTIDDEHAATARDVAAELDTQPEDLPAPPPAVEVEPAEDPLAVLAEIADTAEKNEVEHQRQAAMQTPDWVRWLEIGRERLLDLCFLVNWPARRFLTAEWRANLGYIALLNLFFGVGLWIVLIVF